MNHVSSLDRRWVWLGNSCWSNKLPHELYTCLASSNILSRAIWFLIFSLPKSWVMSFRCTFTRLYLCLVTQGWTEIKVIVNSVTSHRWTWQIKLLLSGEQSLFLLILDDIVQSLLLKSQDVTNSLIHCIILSIFLDRLFPSIVRSARFQGMAVKIPLLDLNGWSSFTALPCLKSWFSFGSTLANLYRLCFGRFS